MASIGFGFLETTLTFSSRGRPPAAAQSRPLTGNLWLCASTSLISHPVSNSPSGIDVFKKFVTPAQAILGVGTSDVSPSSGWSTKNINLGDPIEVALAGELKISALAHVASSTSHAYVGPWNAFV